MYTGQWHLGPLQSRHLGTSHSSPSILALFKTLCKILCWNQLPIVFSWISLTVWNLFPFKGDFSFWKSQKSWGAKSGLCGDWVTWVICCFAKKLHEAWAGMLSWWSCQSPVAHNLGLLNHPNSFHRGMFKLNAKSDADSLLYLLSHFECDGHTVHMLIQQCLLPPLTNTVKSSLFTHVHSSPLSLAARLHQCHTNNSRSINNGWTYSGQNLYIYLY